METIVHRLPNIIVYIDFLFLPSFTHDEHLEQLDLLLQRLIRHVIKINLPKRDVGSKEITYLGFHLTKAGFIPIANKLKVVQDSPPLASQCPRSLAVLRVVQLLPHSCLKFHTDVISPDCPHKKRANGKGNSAPKAFKAFQELHSYLCSEPVIDYPRMNHHYNLITNASLEDGKKPGSIGAILTHTNDKGKHSILACASQKLQKPKKNYTPFLSEGDISLCLQITSPWRNLVCSHKTPQPIPRGHANVRL
jgi:hypothetical protein